MNAPLHSDSPLHSTSESAGVTTSSGYAPSVPISVYRELATELKTTRMTLDSLTQQNQQLVRQNKLLRNEIQRFVQAAEQLGQFAGVMPQPPVHSREEFIPRDQGQPDTTAAPPPRSLADEPFVPDSAGATFNSAIVPHPQARKRDRSNSAKPHPTPNDPQKPRLFTEQPENMRPFSKISSKPDLGNLWLATTILLVVITAFGAGFLIMRPLLNR